MADTLEIFGTEYTNVAGIIATDDNGNELTYTRGGGSPTLQTITKTYTPTTSQQTETITAGVGYDGIEEVDVTVNAMPTGTEGTPTIIKTVGNHQVSVTPSVTNTAGYITGSTKTGMATTIIASEVAYGSETKTTNGTYDVTNLASLVVNVPSGKVATASISNTSHTSSLSFTLNGGQPIAWFLRVSGAITSSGSTTYYYIVDARYNGTDIRGNYFRIGSTRSVNNITSGITQSFNISTHVLTITSSGSRTATPGGFYGTSSGTYYELVYVY